MCEKQPPLKWRSFRERSNFPRIWFRDLRFTIWGLEIKRLKAHNFVWPWCDKGVFSFINISQLRRPSELKYSQICYFMLRYTNCEDYSLWQFPKVSSVFKGWISNSIAADYAPLLSISWFESFRTLSIFNNNLYTICNFVDNGNDSGPFSVLSFHVCLSLIFACPPKIGSNAIFKSVGARE